MRPSKINGVLSIDLILIKSGWRNCRHSVIKIIASALISESYSKSQNLIWANSYSKNSFLADFIATGSNTWTFPPFFIIDLIVTIDGASRISSVPGLNDSPQIENVLLDKSFPNS